MDIEHIGNILMDIDDMVKNKIQSGKKVIYSVHDYP